MTYMRDGEAAQATRCAAPASAPPWLNVLRSSSPLYAVDLQQRIVYWGACASLTLGPAEDALGRRCYEVLPGADPRNARRCRPDCQVITMARKGRPAPDFEIWGSLDEDEPGPQRIDVSILLHEGNRPEDTVVVHLLRCAAAADEVVSAGDGAALPNGQAALTPRQQEILRLLADGRSPDEIAGALGVSRVTVRNHVQAAMERLGARTRLEAAMIAARAGLLSPGPRFRDAEAG